MRYRLDELAKLAVELGLESRRVNTDRLDIVLPGCVLAFAISPTATLLWGSMVRRGIHTT
jgi:hypothetical protein